MTTIKYTPASFEIEGHTGAGMAGNNLVCAAVSFLATTCANALQSVAKVERTAVVRDAYMFIQVKERNMNAEALTIFKTFLQGVKDLQESYPEHIKLILKNEGETK